METGHDRIGSDGEQHGAATLCARHQCVVYDIHPESVQVLVKEGAVGATSLDDFAQKVIAAAMLGWNEWRLNSELKNARS